MGREAFSEVTGGRLSSFHGVMDGGPPGTAPQERRTGRGLASSVHNSLEMTKPGASEPKKRSYDLILTSSISYTECKLSYALLSMTQEFNDNNLNEIAQTK